MQMQDSWIAYVQDSWDSCDPKFWELLATVQNESTICRDRVFSKVKDLTGFKGQRWPRTCRTLRKRVMCACSFVFCVYSLRTW